MKLKENEIEGFLSNPDDGINLFLFYGPDYGLSAERISNLSKTLDVNIDDPFSSSNLKLEDIENNPSKLLEEALTHTFLGGQRLVVFKIYNSRISSNLVNSINNLINHLPIKNTKILILAHDLPSYSPILKPVFSCNHAVSIASYNKPEYKIKSDIKLFLTDKNIGISEDLLRVLSSHLGDDQLNSINQLENLISYIYPKTIITSEDIQNSFYDTSKIELENVVFSVISGNTIQTTKNIEKIFSAGIHPLLIIKSTLLWFYNIRIACEAINSGLSLDDAIKVASPNIFWKTKPKFENGINVWASRNIDLVIDRLLLLEKRIKAFPGIDKTLVSFSLFGLTNLVNNND